MRFRLLVIGFCLAAFMSVPVAADEKIFLCGKDITDAGNPFYWDNLKNIVPENLGPGDARTVYRVISERYVSALSVEDKKLPFVRVFVKLLRGIDAGIQSGNLTIKSGFDEHELSSGLRKKANVPCQDKDKPYLADIKYITIAYKKVHDASWEKLREAAARRIEFLDQQYADWFNNGLPMWPLETWANGALLDKSDAVEPRKWQLIVTRPSVGIGLNAADNRDETDPSATLAIQPLGYLKFTKNDYSQYWGISLLLTVGEDPGLGYGILARYNNYVFGATKRDNDTQRGISDNDVYIFIGFDLYNLMHEKQERFREFKGKVRANLEQYAQ